MERLRHERLHYMEINSELKLIDTEIVSFTENLNVQTTTRQYIGDPVVTQRMRSMQPSYAYQGVMDKDDEVVKYLYKVGADQQLNTHTRIVHVDVWTVEANKKEYTARAGTYTIISENSGSGAAGEDLAISGTLSQAGPLIHGKFDMGTRVFTSDDGRTTIGEISEKM